MSLSPFMAVRSLSRDRMEGRKIAKGTVRRVLGYAGEMRGRLAVFVALGVVGSALDVVPPLLLKRIVDEGVAARDVAVIAWSAVAVAVVAVVQAGIAVVGRSVSSRVGEGLIYRLRTQVFDHISAQPIAFFTRTQTGALAARINSDVIGAQQAFTSVVGSALTNVVSLIAIVVAMAAMSWQLTMASLLLFPLFMLPSRRMGARLSDLTREAMTLNSDLSTRTQERFNVAGALLVKLFGRPAEESAQYAERAAAVRDIGVSIATNRSAFMQLLALLAALATALVYGVGGWLAVEGSLTVGTLLALAALLARLYQPLIGLSGTRVDVLTALVSFERIFEVLDLRPLVTESPRPAPLPAGVPSVSFEDVRFGYPSADQVSLTSLEGATTGDRSGGAEVLKGVGFDAAPGTLVALVGPSGAGKSTITSLVARLYDPSSGTVRLGGVDLRDVSFADLRRSVGVVTQDAHLFHDTVRANLLYARPQASDAEIEEALRAAQIWGLIERLPEGLDTVVGDRGHRLSGGEKQRLAIARLLLKAPGVVVLDEATAHLDSESEAAVQRALDTALHGRTALVIAHRLSTVRDADQILVVDGGRVVQRGTHDELLASGGLYADLYATQFRDDATVGADPGAEATVAGEGPGMPRGERATSS